MRARTRTFGGNTTLLPSATQKWYSSEYAPGTQLDWQAGVGLRLFPERFSSITDVVGNQGGLNPVTHISFTSSLGTKFRDWKRNNLAQTAKMLFDGIYVPMQGTLPDAFGLLPFAPVISSATLSDWAVEAYNAFHDQVPVTVSLPNFIYELKDMKGMIPSVDRLSLTKTASNNFLAFEFGVLPFISDIKAILSLSTAVEKRLKHLIETAGSSTRLSFNRSTVHDEPATFWKALGDPNHVNTTSSGIDLEFVRSTARSEFHCGAQLFQDLKDLSDALATMKALSASGGFNHPARVIWNAIPYSFVVDWFFHVGKLLDSLSVQPFGGTYDVSAVMYSIKTESHWRVFQNFSNGTPADNAYNRQDIGYVNAESYIRRLGFPAQSLFLTNGALTPMQLALSVAMLEQRRH